MKRVLAVLALAMAWPLSAGAASREADEAALRHIKTEVWPGFYRRQDAKGLDAFLDPAFVNIAPDGSMSTKAEELEGVRGEPWNPKNFRYTIGRFVWLSDDLVVVVGRGESDRADENGKPCRHGYASSNLLKRAADAPLKWRALYSHVSGDACVPM